jgi:hypothetical protein
MIITPREELAARAPDYVPEWRYNPSSLDAGAALALIWDNLFSGTLERYGRLAENCRLALLDTIGSEPKPALPARGYLVFEPDAEADCGIIVSAKTGIAGPKGSDTVMETDRELVVSPAKIEEIYCALPSQGSVRRHEGRENIPLFKAEGAETHVWTFYHPYAFAVSRDASLRLYIELNGGDTACLCGGVEWEFEDGQQWKPLRARQDGDNLLLEFLENTDAPCRRIRFSLPGAGCPDNSLISVRAFPTGNALFPDAVYTEDTQQDGDSVFPFERHFMPGSCFYVACNDALGKPGALVELSFFLRFEDFPIEGYPEWQIHWRKVMKSADLEPPPEYTVQVSEVVWEYFNGTGWAILSAGDPGMFANGLERRCALRFTCPADIAPTVCGAHEGLYIRARVRTVENIFRIRGYYRAPVLSALRFRYTGDFPVTDAKVYGHWETRRLQPGIPAPLIGTLPLPGAMYFTFNSPFGQGSILFDVVPGKSAPLRWEYSAENGWAPLDVHDGTHNLSQTGIVIYQTPVPCAKARMFGREGYWMRVVDIENTYCEFSGLHLLGLYENAVTATARTPGGEANMPSRAFHSILDPIPGILGAYNPLPCHGGMPGENEESIIRRLTAGFHHGGRAVSPPDIERLALEASQHVRHARCYPKTGADGFPSDNCDCVAVLGGDADEIQMYLEDLRPLGAGRLAVTEARFIGVNVTLSAAIERPEDALSIKRHVLRRLSEFLDPDLGGWQIGQLPSPEAITALLRSVPELLWISKINIAYTRGSASADYRRAAEEPFAFPADGKHEIRLFAS